MHADCAAIFLPWWGDAPGWERALLQHVAGLRSMVPVLVGDAASWCSEFEVPRIATTMDEFERHASAVSGVEIHKRDPEYPRGQLLCELRPMMADMYPHHLDGFTWWGYGDWDVVWGDWDGFFAAGGGDGYDVITTNAATVNGPLTLLRNDGRTSQLYRRRLDILRCPLGCHHLDEPGLDGIVKDEEDRGCLRCLYLTNVSNDQHERWLGCVMTEGKLYGTDAQGDVGSEILKFHFRKQKRWPLGA